MPIAQGCDVMKYCGLDHLNACACADPAWFPDMPDDLRELFTKVTKGSLSGVAGQPATEDFRINGQYVDRPEKGVVGIPFFDGYVQKAALEFLDDAAKTPDSPFFISVNLDRLQIIKGWLDADGNGQERVYDVAVSGDRVIARDGRCKTPVGGPVKTQERAYTSPIWYTPGA